MIIEYGETHMPLIPEHFWPYHYGHKPANHPVPSTIGIVTFSIDMGFQIWEADNNIDISSWQDDIAYQRWLASQ